MFFFFGLHFRCFLVGWLVGGWLVGLVWFVGWLVQKGFLLMTV